jgi:hypothetical protein
MGRNGAESRKAKRALDDSGDDGSLSVSRAPHDGITGRVLGVRLSALIEIALFLVGALVIDHFVFSGNRFANLEPHPFWIIVLLISVQYGTNEGIIAALASSAALLVGNLPQQTIGQDYYAYLFGVALNPMMWCITAIVIGELRTRYARRERQLTDALSDAEHREERIALAYQELIAAHERLEVSVASELSSVLTLYRASKRLQNLSPDEVLDGAADMVATVMSAHKYSIYRLDQGRLNLALARGWSETDHFRAEFTSADRLFQTVVARQIPLSITDPAQQQILDGEGLLAGPILDAEGGEILGMLKVEDMSFADLNFNAIENFKMLCELLGTALANARRFEFITSESIVSGPSMLYSDADYSRQTAFLAALARRLNFPVSIMRLTVVAPESLDPAAKSRLPALVRDCTFHILRSTDLAFEFRSSQWQYVIVLPNTPMSNMRIVSEKYRIALEKGLRDTHVHVEIDMEPLVDASELTPGATPVAENTMADYTRETQFLIALSRRAGFPVSGLRVSIVLTVDLPDVVRHELSTALLAIVRRSLSEADLVFNLEPMGQVIAVLLPGVALPDARRKASQIRAALAERLRPLGNSVTAEIAVRELVAGQRAATRRVPPAQQNGRVTEIDDTPRRPAASRPTGDEAARAHAVEEAGRQ